MRSWYIALWLGASSSGCVQISISLSLSLGICHSLLKSCHSLNIGLRHWPIKWPQAPTHLSRMTNGWCLSELQAVKPAPTSRMQVDSLVIVQETHTRRLWGTAMETMSGESGTALISQLELTLPSFSPWSERCKPDSHLRGLKLYCNQASSSSRNIFLWYLPKQREIYLPSTT